MLSIRRCAVWLFVILVVVGGIATVALPIRAEGADTEWRAWGGNLRSTKYSPLDQINRHTVKRLKIAWRQPATPPEMVAPGEKAPVIYHYQHTPLMVDGRLYMSTGYGTVAALDPGTGKVIWFDKPVLPATASDPTRALAYWTDGKDARIVANNGRFLVALNAKTGKRYPDFGENGQVDLMKGYERPVDGFLWPTGPSVVVRDVIVVGSNVPDVLSAARPTRKEGRSGDVRGFDVRTGKQLWTFHTVPRAGEVGNETWENGSWQYTGHTNVWPPMSADEELGYVYLPVTTPTNDVYGGHRLGNNLFGCSIVAIEAKTGRRVWHFQIEHHPLFDYDPPTPPVLADVVINGQKRRILAQATKQAFLFVLDRVTGQPIWPVEERPVPQSTVPGERTSPTQPFPLDARGRVFAYDQQGVTIDDLIDFTPALRAEAMKILEPWAYGPMYFPTVLPGVGSAVGKKGAVLMPGTSGGTSWTGAAFDPDTSTLYVQSAQMPLVAWLTKGPPGSDADYVRERHEILRGPQGLPIFKPPYGRIVAIDLSKGLIKWTAADGDGPRDHPALRGLKLPPLGTPVRKGVLATKSLLFVGEGYPRFNNFDVMGGKKFRAFDKATGAIVWETQLDGATTGIPMTYMWRGKQYIVTAIGWGAATGGTARTGGAPQQQERHPGELIALALE